MESVLPFMGSKIGTPDQGLVNGTIEFLGTISILAVSLRLRNYEGLFQVVCRMLWRLTYKVFCQWEKM